MSRAGSKWSMGRILPMSGLEQLQYKSLVAVKTSFCLYIKEVSLIKNKPVLEHVTCDSTQLVTSDFGNLCTIASSSKAKSIFSILHCSPY